MPNCSYPTEAITGPWCVRQGLLFMLQLQQKQPLHIPSFTRHAPCFCADSSDAGSGKSTLSYCTHKAKGNISCRSRNWSEPPGTGEGTGGGAAGRGAGPRGEGEQHRVPSTARALAAEGLESPVPPRPRMAKHGGFLQQSGSSQ